MIPHNYPYAILYSSAIPGTRANLDYLDQLSKFHYRNGVHLNRFPSVDRRPLDLYRLKLAVERRGGFDTVCKSKKWAEIGRDMGYSGKIMSSLSTSLKNSYQRWLMPYEDYIRLAKPEHQQRFELNDGPPLASSSSRQSPIPPPLKEQNPASDKDMRTSPSSSKPTAATSFPIEAQSGHNPVGVPAPATEETPQTAQGFGFTALNKASAFVAVNGSPSVKNEADNAALTPKSVPDYTNNDQSEYSMKRSASHDSSGEGSQTDNGDDDNSNGRRSKRLKKGKWALS